MDPSKQGSPPEYNDIVSSEEHWRGRPSNGEQGNKGIPPPPNSHPQYVQNQQPQTQYVQNHQPMYYHQQQQQGPYQQQPGYVYGPQGQIYVAQQSVAMEPPPPDWALLSWFTCLCCCWPIGLIAVIKSCDVNSAIRSGDIARARESSDSAKKFAYFAFGCGVFCSVLWLILWIVFADSFHNNKRHHFHF